uniref:F-box domain-containing protein n=1 Tax=Leersia perrieri TaxID=77586 RepID=A0A0D9X898_9ORYZ
MVGAPPPPSTTAPKPSTTTISDLNEDLLLQILLRLPSLTNLVCTAFTCRPWLTAIASSSEFRPRFRALHPEPLLGHFANADTPEPPLPTPTPSSPPFSPQGRWGASPAAANRGRMRFFWACRERRVEKRGKWEGSTWKVEKSPNKLLPRDYTKKSL